MTTIGVVGAGTMGAGIAQLAAAAAFRTLLHDPVPEALQRGTESARRGLAKWVEKGRTDSDSAALLEPVSTLDELAPCNLVIEAAPERADLKRDLFGALSLVCGDDVVLATNTSSIPVTSLAGAAARPERVVGMHFFNPPPLMPLLEVIRADQSADEVVERAIEVGRAMGKRVIVAADGPGFLVNRCGRPFSGEGLRLLAEGVATHEQIDRICRLGGGFRMGPFELMDLVGVDVGFEVAKSFHELSFGEPRWRPSTIQARMVAAGRLGRKTGSGYYDYADDGSYRPDDPEPLANDGGEGLGTFVSVLGRTSVASLIQDAAREAGYELREGGPTELVIDARIRPDPSPPGGAPLGVLCAASSLAARGEPGAVGFHLLPDARLVELTRLPTTQQFAADAVEEFFRNLGLLTEWVEDAPGLVLGRIVCQLVNEAAFAIGEGVGSADDVDAGLTLGLSHPRGPVEWSEAIGVDHVVAVLDGLWAERREERYRTAPLLRRAAALGRSLREEWPPPT
ncbi:MAG TPA: 3-hydroxyacyl-CoA dehydrogenase NAD-binding domain-containing protein [Thermoleophilaceae bacterium]|nr:3-hydroxyacyl-CoA dehydrogenase NAD-binding domain-containing protein [Thermoleophilaceae bacterium]